MRHPTAVLFWGLVAAVVLWVGAAALTPHAGSWSGHHGMMGSGLLAGPGARGWMNGRGAGLRVLSQDGGAPGIADVEQAMNQWIAAEGNPRLKLGPVTEKDSSTIQADVVTKDGSLVQRFDVDRRDGRIAPVED